MTADQHNDYRRYADACMQWAKQANSDQERLMLLDMAQVWLALVVQAQNGPSAKDGQKLASH